jgi:CRP/FNR family transcriptional regulator
MGRHGPFDDLLEAFPALAELHASEYASLIATGEQVTLEAGATVFEAGQHCDGYLLVNRGSIRVHLIDEEGHEVVLYRLGPGDTCVLSTASALGGQPHAAYAVAETKTAATTMPLRDFEALVTHSAAFRRFVFASHARRLRDVMQVLSNVAFQRIDVRLAHCLLERADARGIVHLTHAAIAIEMGTAREVISRNLKRFERMGYLKLGRQAMRLDAAALTRFAGGERAD